MRQLLEPLTGFLLLDPWLLLLGFPLAWASWRSRRREPAVRFGPAPLAFERAPGGGHRPHSWRARLACLPRLLQVLALALVVVALARPAERSALPLRAAGIDIVLCLDTSSSMGDDDLDPGRSRLQVAKEAAREFVRGRASDRVGLISFARYPDLRCPLTLDHAAVERFLESMERVETDGAEDATGIGTALALAARILGARDARSKIVILLTDGEENVASVQNPEEIAPIHAGQLCKDMGIRVYTIVAGTGRRDAQGARAPLDVTQMQRICEKTAGAFYEARDAEALERVYAAIDDLEKTTFEAPRYEMRDHLLPFLLAAVGLMVASRVLAATVFEALP